MDPTKHAESALVEIGNAVLAEGDRRRVYSGIVKAISLAVAEDRAERRDRSAVFRLTLEWPNKKPLTWLVEAPHMEAALAVVNEEMVTLDGVLGVVRTIENLGLLMIRT